MLELGDRLVGSVGGDHRRRGEPIAQTVEEVGEVGVERRGTRRCAPRRRDGRCRRGRRSSRGSRSRCRSRRAARAAAGAGSPSPGRARSWAAPTMAPSGTPGGARAPSSARSSSWRRAREVGGRGSREALGDIVARDPAHVVDDAPGTTRRRGRRRRRRDDRARSAPCPRWWSWLVSRVGWRPIVSRHRRGCPVAPRVHRTGEQQRAAPRWWRARRPRTAIGASGSGFRPG